ncbi:MAG: response regulator transcription factor [Gammaproteobacteria bacterium]|nr:response regulator transcription factor [Gammaproteobacteria bacterium]MCP5298817.1 response regulator transcription factor [Chromatiaceae bacterium]
MRILVVEDETTLREQLAFQLKQRGYSVDAAADGEEGLFLGREYPMDLAIIDLGLPGISGIQLIRELRKLSRAFPILILTARDAWQDKVEGLESGADDYLTKPFHGEELMARVNALLRRAAGHASPVLEVGGLRVDTLAQRVSIDGADVTLTAHEYRILEYLTVHAGKVVSKTELTEHVYDQDFDRDSNVVEVLVGRIRKKIDPAGARKPIETLRGRGYRLVQAG